MSDPKPPPLPPEPSPIPFPSGREILTWIATAFGVLLLIGGLIGFWASLYENDEWYLKPRESYYGLHEGEYTLHPPQRPVVGCALIAAVGCHLIVLAQILRTMVESRDTLGPRPGPSPLR
jgi:hypothetical protein